jgi:GT2 family glycosyltransferase
MGTGVPDVSVLIVSYNTRDILRQCLETVRAETGSLQVETIVIDNASRDGSPEMVVAEFPEVLVIQTGANLGFAGANNVGIEKARGRYCVLLNSDAFLCQDALAVAVRLMDANPGAGIGGARLVGRDGESQPSARLFPSLLNEFLMISGLAYQFPKSSFFGRFDRTWADQSKPAEVDWVPGAFMIVRTEPLQSLHGFDTAFFFYYEEVDLCRRMKMAGNSVWYWPEIRVIHLGGESSKVEAGTMNARATLWRLRSGLLYHRKHHGPAVLAVTGLELGWHAFRYLKNRVISGSRGKAAESRALVQLIRQAWRETRGGRLSPAAPW